MAAAALHVPRSRQERHPVPAGVLRISGAVQKHPGVQEAVAAALRGHRLPPCGQRAAAPAVAAAARPAGAFAVLVGPVHLP